MANFFNSIRITNFKSLKDVTLSDCKRINLLIGKPNVGKSNILEAIGLFGLPYIKFNENKMLTSFIRLENIPELFFDGNINEKINIETNVNVAETKGSQCVAKYLKDNGLLEFNIEIKDQLDLNNEPNNERPYFLPGEGDRYKLAFNNQLSLFFMTPGHDNNIYPVPPKVKGYKFSHQFFKKPDFYLQHLIPPDGENLLDVLQANKELRTALAKIFSEYSLKLLFDTGEYRLKLMKTLADDNIITFPYNSIADTLQRVIFFKAAIASNLNSILLFEEPEAHCFPPYVTHITQEIIDSETNQFFVATHSPYVLTTCLERESSRKDVAIFMVDFKDGQTVINRLTDDERDEVYEYGLDLFFNSELFTDD